MPHRPLRACVSILLMFTLLSMMLPRVATAMPMALQGMTQNMHMLHGMEQIADHVPDSAARHDGQHGQCHCGVHCGLCGVCHSTLSSATAFSFTGMGAMPAGPRLSNLVEIYLSPDPHPPRA